jgi:hypothetical protein
MVFFNFHQQTTLLIWVCLKILPQWMVDLNNSLHILQQSNFFVAKNPAILAGFAVAHFSLVNRRPNLMVDLILPSLNILNGHRSEVNPFFFGWQQLPPFLLCWILYQSSDYSIVFEIITMYRRLLAQS